MNSSDQPIPNPHRARPASPHRMSKPPKLQPMLQTLKALRERHQLANCVLLGELQFAQLRREQEAVGVDITTAEHITYYGLRVIRVAAVNYLRAATEY